MKLKVTQPIIDYTGIPFQSGATVITASLLEIIKKSTKEELLEKLNPLLSEPLTYRDVINQALNSVMKDEIMTAQDKSKAYEITLKCFASKEPDFTPSQIEFIINRVEKIYLLPLVIGRVNAFFKDK